MWVVGEGGPSLLLTLLARDRFCHEVAVYVTSSCHHHEISWREIWPLGFVPHLTFVHRQNFVVNFLLKCNARKQSLTIVEDAEARVVVNDVGVGTVVGEIGVRVCGGRVVVGVREAVGL